ncbi:MAG: macrolide family glycosyltransferase, partial [Pseudonocardia sediminis]
MSHILMVGVGAHGHTNPHLPVMTELVARGHRVTYAISKSFATTVATSGATPLVVETALPDETAAQHWPTDAVSGMRLFLDEGRTVLPQLLDALDRDRPDAVLYDIGGYAGRVLAHRWDLPLLQLSPSIVAWEGYEEDMGDAMAFLDEPDGLAFQHDFDAWLGEQGIDIGWAAFSGRPPRCAALVPEAMQPNAERVDHDVVTFVGPALDRRPHEEEWPEPDRPLLVVSLGSAYNDRPRFFRDVIAAMDGLDWRVAMSIGPYVDPADLGAIPENVDVRSWLPQLAALRHASAFVTHAGMGGCSEGLHEGVPMVAVPQAVDQFGNAARLVELGVGEHLPADEVTPERLREAILRVSGSPEVAARCAELRERARAAGGARAAADILEDML